MENLFSDLSERYNDRIVIIDSPPILSTNEASILSRRVGQIVFVIEAGKTPQPIIEDALELLPREKAIGLVLNKSESASNRGGYYYNYYSRYGERDD